jgi:hypothetical protein
MCLRPVQWSSSAHRRKSDEVAHGEYGNSGADLVQCFSLFCRTGSQAIVENASGPGPRRLAALEEHGQTLPFANSGGVGWGYSIGFVFTRLWRFRHLVSSENAGSRLGFETVDGGPLPRWRFGRCTPLGDVHPMYPFKYTKRQRHA